MLRLHSELLPQLFGVPPLAVMLLYLILSVLWFVGHRREIRRTRNVLLYAAVRHWSLPLSATTVFRSAAYTL
jgi:hypothetical protein